MRAEPGNAGYELQFDIGRRTACLLVNPRVETHAAAVVYFTQYSWR